MEPAQLQLLALIDRCGSMAGAAQALGRTPAAVTQQLAKAERELGTTLVHRGPRGAALTAAGALLAQHGRVIDEETQRAASGLDGLLGRLSLRLRIGAFQAAALHLLPPALTALRHRYPDADLTVTDITSDVGIDEVVAGRLDVAVIASWDTPLTPPERVTVHPLLRDPMVVVLPDDHPALAAPGPVGLAQLRDEAWVTILAGHAARAQFDRVTAAAGFVPRIRFQTASYDVAQALVGTGIGVALVSRLALAHAPGTAHRALRPPVPHRDLQVVTMTDATVTPLVAVFLRLLQDVAGKGDGDG
ncbi:LysR family transcriptional regulator [Actinoplanes sp. NPDC048791]|uniref:LysR family transcriptional regulator n=1 Tax=Actinoplanes sp. NPDC048791 TaxID=3154623 RepID=UPI0033C1E6A6